MSFRLIDAAKKEFPVQRLCKILGVSPRGYFAWKGRPACHRQRTDLVLLAYIRSAFALSNETYGSPRMVHELRDAGLPIGRRRTARLMRENGLKAHHRQPACLPHRAEPAPPGLRRDRSEPEGGGLISPTYGRERAGCTLPLSSTYSPGASSAGPPAIACTRNWPCRPYAVLSLYGARQRD